MDKPLPKSVILRHTPPPATTTTTTATTPPPTADQPPPTGSTCQHCSAKESPLWRRGERGEILCNACGLYWKHHNRYRPLVAGEEPQKAVQLQQHGKRIKTTPKRTALMPVDTNLVIQNGPQPNSSRESKPYTDFAKRPRLRPALAPKPPHPPHQENQHSIRFIMHGHRMLFPGDHVVVKGDDKLAYYAILVDFSLEPKEKRKQCLLKWLLPKPEYTPTIFADSHSVEPHMFTVGEEHQQWEPLECILDTFYSPYQHGVVSAKSPVLEDLEAAHWLLSMS